MASILCPTCANGLHRSHSHGIRETLVKSFSAYRPYRCGDCGWRGWLAKQNSALATRVRLTVLSTVLVILAAILITLITLRVGL